MKTFIISLLFITACASMTEPKVPCRCKRNLQDCITAYSKNRFPSKEYWNTLCLQDLNVCKSEYGFSL